LQVDLALQVLMAQALLSLLDQRCTSPVAAVVAPVHLEIMLQAILECRAVMQVADADLNTLSM
jgi:hypothetical protein